MSTSIYVTCGHCDTVNRLPEDRLGQSPRCGRCKQAVFTGKPLELNRDNLENVLQHNNLPVLVDCWAPWCGPCLSFAPQFEKAAEAWEPRLRFAKLDTDAEPDIAGRWNIRSIPTLILFRDGVEQQRTSGALPLPQLQQWLQHAGVE